MTSRMMVNKYEMNKNHQEYSKEEKEINKEHFKRDNYDKDIESIVKRDKENTSIMWGFVLGFLLFIVIFVMIMIFTI